MPTVTDHPNALGAYAQWAANQVSQVADVSSNDGDTSVVYGHNGQRIRWKFANLPAPATAVSSCTVYMRTRDEDVGGPQMFCFNGASEVSMTTGQGTSYALRSTAFGGALTVAGVNAGELGLFDSAGAGINTYCTEFYRTTIYTAAVGTYAGTTAAQSGVAGDWARGKASAGTVAGESGVAASYSFVPSAGAATYTYNGSLDVASGVPGDWNRTFVPVLAGIVTTAGVAAAYKMQRTIYVFGGAVAIVSGVSNTSEYHNNFVRLEGGRYVWGFSDRYLEEVAAVQARLEAVEVDGSLLAALERGDTFQWVQHKPSEVA